ncbi:MAG: hypothetical protein ACXWM6_04535 [Thermodesulfobacteriota bacterium]
MAYRIILEQISVSCRLILGKLWIVLIAFFLLQAIPRQAEVKETPEVQKVPAPQASAGIPIEEVAKKATEVSNLLRSFNMLLSPSPDIETIQKRLPGVSRDIALGFSDTKKVLQALPTLAILQSAQQLWEKRQTEMTHWLNLLSQRTTDLQVGLNKLADLQKTWSQTRDAAEASKAPELILQQIDAIIGAIEASASLWGTETAPSTSNCGPGRTSLRSGHRPEVNWPWPFTMRCMRQG